MRKIEFEYELYNKDGQFKKKLYSITACNVRYTSFGQLKGSATFTTKSRKDIDYLNDRIKIFCIIDGIRHPLGEYLISSGKRSVQSGVVYRECTCYSKLLILQDDRTKNTYSVNIGTNVIVEVKRLLGTLPFILEDSPLTLQSSKEWEIGTSKLQIINDLLDIINWNSLRVDANGVFTTEPYTLPINRQIDFVLKDDEHSIIYPEQEEELHAFSVPNVVILRTNNSDITPPLSSVYENHNADSPTSIESRGREIVYFEDVQDVPNQAILNDLARKRLYEKTDVYSHIELTTAIQPEAFGYLKCIYLQTNRFDGKYIQTSCEIDCRAGGQMKRTLRKVVRL